MGPGRRAAGPLATLLLVLTLPASAQDNATTTAPEGTTRSDDEAAQIDDEPAGDAGADDDAVASSGQAAVDEAATAEAGAPPASSDTPADLPDALPPLDDDFGALLGDAAVAGVQSLLDRVELFGHGRARLEVDEGRDLGDDPSLTTGLALTGRVGVVLPVGPHRAKIVLGDGQRFGPVPHRAGADPATSFPIGALGLIYELNVDFGFDALGEGTRFVLGRQEYFLADERYIGRAVAHPRGRTFDGLSATWVNAWLTAQAGAFYLGPLTGDDAAQPSGVAAASVDHRGERALGNSPWLDLDWAATGYGFVHRDGTPARFDLDPLTVGTVGSRGHVGLAFVTAHAGADFQLPVRDVAPLAPPGWGAHVEGDVSFAPHVSLFQLRGAPVMALFGESSFGQPVAGRALRAPGPALHRHLGDLDLVFANNVTSFGARVGISLPDQVDLLLIGRVIGMSDPAQGLRDTTGTYWVAPTSTDLGLTSADRWAFTEVDARLSVNLGYGTKLVAAYAVAVPGPVVGDVRAIQRLWLSLVFDASAAPG